MRHSRILIALLALSALFMFALTAMAQEQQGASGGQDQPRRPQMMTPQERLDAMAKALNLTDEQKDKIKPILEDQQKQMQDLRADTSMSREDRMAKMQDINSKNSEKIKAILNDDQKKKYDEMMSRRRGGGGGGRPQGPPPGF